MLEEKENLPVQNASDDKKSYVLAVAIGLILILAIAFLTVFKNYSASNKQKEAQKEAEENIQKAAKISVDELQNKIIKGESVAIVDIRTTQEYKSEHIRDSKNISLDDFQNLWPSLDKKKTYVIVDDGKAMEGATVASEMAKEGFENAYYLGGGYIAWTNKNKPTVSAGDPSSVVDYAKTTQISPDELNAWLYNEEERRDLFLIDLRSAQEYAKEHLEYSINIPLDDLEKREKEIPSAKDIVLYGDADVMGFRGGVKLFDLGHFNSPFLTGGIEEWKKKGLKTTK